MYLDQSDGKGYFRLRVDDGLHFTPAGQSRTGEVAGRRAPAVLERDPDHHHDDDGRRVASVAACRSIARDGVRLAFVDSGAGEPAVVLLHGMACVHDHMLPVMRHLESRHRCVAVDLRGHGASDAPLDAYAMDDFLADLDALIGELGLGRPILVGHSFGGSIALAYADRYPERVAALVMLDSGMRSNQVLTADLGPFYEALRSGDDARYRSTLGAFVRERLVDPVDGEELATEIAATMSDVPSHVFLSMSDTVQQLRSAEMAARASCRRCSCSRARTSPTRPPSPRSGRTGTSDGSWAPATSCRSSRRSRSTR